MLRAGVQTERQLGVERQVIEGRQHRADGQEQNAAERVLFVAAAIDDHDRDQVPPHAAEVLKLRQGGGGRRKTGEYQV